MLDRLNSSTLTEFVDVKTSAFILRLAAFLMIFNHGYGKVMNVLGGNFQFGDPIGLGPEVSLILAALAEGIGALLVLLGFWTRLGALLLIINMSVAILFHHIPAGDSFGRIELPLLYLIIFLTVFLLGPGKFSIDDNSRS
ncbi:MAG TPA: DoxX family protein [Balneolaceae bacterium]|nr:DoxX family protein [Balneolaceae bacterium]